MLIKRILTTVIAIIVSLPSIFFGSSSGGQAKCTPAFTGTFLQSWYSSSWDDARWEAEVEAMQTAGIKYLILQSTAEKNSSSRWNVYYNSSLSEFDGAAYSGTDVIEAALRHCKNTGIKVFVGLNMFEGFWTFGAITDEYGKICSLAADMAEEIYLKYYNDYSDAFGGWYFVPEINNMIICSLNTAGICKGLNTVIAEIDSLNPALPLILSPFNSDYLSTGSVSASIEWITLFGLTDFRDGDIFAPQDAVGALWTKEENLRRNWEMFKTAADSCEAEVRLWANCENFDIAIPSSFGSSIITRPATENTEYVTSTLDRFVNQMKIASEYCENIITFSYNHYFSPNAVSPIYMNTYLDYLENGYSLEVNAPSRITDFRKTQSGNAVLLTWSEPEDDFGIAYYRICKNGEFLARVEGCFGNVLTQFSDPGASESAEYTITAFDAAGNASPASTAE